MTNVVRLAMEARQPMREALAEWQHLVDVHGAHLTYGETVIRCFTEVTPEAADAFRTGRLSPEHDPTRDETEETPRCP